MRTSLSLMLVVGLLGCEQSPSRPVAAPPAPAVPAVPAAPTPVAPAAPARDEIPPAAGSIDPCVLGEWRLLPENAKQLYRAILSLNSAPVDVASVSGSASLSLNAAGNASSSLNGMTITYGIQNPNGQAVDMSLVLDGSTSARFTAADGSMSFSDATSHIGGRMKVRIAGREQEMPFNSAVGDLFGGTQSGTSRYRCEEGRLIVQNAAANGLETTWVR